MNIHFRTYKNCDDYKLVSNFLIQYYKSGNLDGNWLEPAWEYMHNHPYLDRLSLEKIGIWEDDGSIAAVVHYESQLGEAFFEFHPAYKHLKIVMLEYAEKNLFGTSEDGSYFLNVFVNDFDDEFTSLVKERGYKKDDRKARTMLQFIIPTPFPPISLPDGFCLKSLSDDCNWRKIHRVLWRGFNHSGEPPEGEVEERMRMQGSLNFKPELKVVVEAPDGNFASFCGMWFEPLNHYAYVEPVATDPDFRRMGLGKAAVLEGIRRCGLLGATVTYVGNDLSFYQALGFRKVYSSECWVKNYPA
jgi:ribosomal protein S18 acetylase RimI-like enzyme